MTKMLEDVISIGKISSGKKEYEITEFSLTSSIKSIINIVSSNSANSHKFVFNYTDTDYMIQTDNKLFNNILLNIIANAIKFSPKSSEIIIDLYPKDDNYVISVSDQGIGIDDEDMKNIFEPFFRAKNIGNISGTGLGLAIVKNSLSIIQGKINIESKLDESTKVTIELPQVFKNK